MRQEIRDNSNILLGWISDEGSQKTAWSSGNILLGTYRNGSTYNSSNIRIADGDVLSSLIYNNR